MVLAGLPTKAAADDFYVIADSPVSTWVEGPDVTFDWHLRKDRTQTRFILHTNAGPPIDLPTHETQYTWEDFPYGAGWWWVEAWREGKTGRYGETNRKLFHHDFPDDWDGLINYRTGRYDSQGRIEYYELQSDYEVNLTDFFDDPEKLPDCCEDEALFYNVWAANLPACEWDFIHLDPGGELTIKQGYRWDGTSKPCKKLNLKRSYCPDEKWGFRSSLVHDVLYDLMRMNYLDSDKIGERPEGNLNRKMADMIHYMIAMEDDQAKDGAQSDYFWLRVWGADATHDESKLDYWKFHVFELTATSPDGRVELEWKPRDYSGKYPFPLVWDIITINDGYHIVRDGEEIGDVPPSATSYVDEPVADGIYTYQIRPLLSNSDQDDWSNTVQVAVGIVLPVITSVTPDSGSRAETVDVAIEGNCLTAASTVSFGAEITVNYFTVDSDNQITANITIDGGAAPGPRDVSVTTPEGDDTLTDGFTVLENTAPLLSDGAVDPDTGYVTTDFTYSVTYTDIDNDPPNSPTVSIDGGGAIEMTEVDPGDTDYTDGKAYEHTTEGLPKDIAHTFQFAASDGTANATGDIDIHDGPTVSSGGVSGGGVVLLRGRDTRAPFISNIECADCTKTSIIIKWKTDERCTGRVEYWASEHMFSPWSESYALYHEVELTDLKPCCVYHFRTISKDRAGNEAISEEDTFNTLGTPATFAVSALSISPAEVEVGESITVSTLITNTGDGASTYEATLKIEDVAVATKSVTLAGGASEEVTFTTSKDAAGTYTVSTDSQSGTVVVMTPPTLPPAPEAPPAPPPTLEAPINWWLIGGIIAGVAIVGLGVSFLIRRRAA
ncbi:hypothetical protein ES708_07083 [subsurface metagenome]